MNRIDLTFNKTPRCPGRRPLLLLSRLAILIFRRRRRWPCLLKSRAWISLRSACRSQIPWPMARPFRPLLSRARKRRDFKEDPLDGEKDSALFPAADCAHELLQPDFFILGSRRLSWPQKMQGWMGLLFLIFRSTRRRSLPLCQTRWDRDGLFLAPTTAQERMPAIVKAATGFIYVVSVAGVDGFPKAVPSDIVRQIKMARTITKKPICVGFGVSNPGAGEGHGPDRGWRDRRKRNR